MAVVFFGSLFNSVFLDVFFSSDCVRKKSAQEILMQLMSQATHGPKKPAKYTAPTFYVAERIDVRLLFKEVHGGLR